MKRFLLAILTLLLLPLATFAQERTYSIEIDAKSLAPVQTDPISGVMIDKINPDRSQRPCARIKIHINRMSRDEISELSVKAIGGNVEVMRQIVARQGNGLILELTAKDPTRFYLHHPKYGDSNEVSLSLEGDKEYRLEAQLNYMHSVVISSNTINAEVYLDNEFKGRIGDNYTLSISEVLPGAHKIRIQDGTLKTETDVEVSSSSFSFRVELNQALARPQYVVFIIEPKEAAITIDGKAIMPNAEGVAQIMLSNGSYKYSISAKEYYAESGEFIVNGAKVVKNISLRPAFGYLSIPATGDLADAGVYIDNSLIGKTPITNYKVANGTHKVRIIKELYKVSEGTVVISEGEKTEYAPTLVADFANVTLSAGDGCEIFVNNEKMGLSPWSGRLATGAYIFEARKSGHRPSTISKSISATQQPQSYTIPAPKPILGSLNVTSSPIMAQVFIDDKLVGETPLMVDVVVGEHEISLRKGELSTKPQSITIEEGRTATLNLTLIKAEPPQSTHKTYIENANCGLNMKMVYVEGGTFQMGATSEEEGAESDEMPVHSVTLSSYYIAECEVTQAQWQKIMGINPSYYTGDPNRPVDQVSWNDAQAFCRKLSALTGKRYVLPTEAQWEYAARGGKHSKGYKYSGNNTINNVAWYRDNGGSRTHPVKQKQPNELGLYDMSGNVYEWCSDWYRNYTSKSRTNPTGPSSGEGRVLRGGSWIYYAQSCRVTHRSSYVPSSYFRDSGFRVVCLP